MPTSEENPYRSPVIDELTPPASDRLPRSPLIRWRVIPVGVFAASGIASLISGVAGLCATILSLAFAERLPKLWYAPLLALPLNIIAGAVWIKASRAWLRAHWRRAMVLTVLGYALLAMAAAFLMRRIIP
jgi:hypothetical protein